MSLLIDGYNLLHATDLFGEGDSAGTLQGSREALLAFLVGTIRPAERRRTTVVFDAAEAPPGLPDRYKVDGIDVRYARGYPDADTLLEKLIEEWRAPKELTVVSSDHRVQRAARRRGAKPVDSEQFYSRQRNKPRQPGSEQPHKEAHEIEAPEFWVERFADPELLAEVKRHEEQLRQRPQPAKPEMKPSAGRPRERRQPFGEGILDPFPPGYADDLAEAFEEEPDPRDGSPPVE